MCPTRRTAKPSTYRCPRSCCATLRAMCCSIPAAIPTSRPTRKRAGAASLKVMTPIMQPGDNVINALAGVGLECRRHRRGRLLAPASRPLRLQHFLQARDLHHPRQGDRSGARAGRRSGGLYRRRVGAAGAAGRDRRRARPVRRRPHRADPPARPYARLDRRAGRSSKSPEPSCSPPTPSACARRSIPASFRATPGTPRRWRSRSPRSGGSRRAAPPCCAVTTRRNGRRCAKAPTPMNDAPEIHARPKIVGARIKRTEDPRLLDRARRLHR